MLLTTDAVPFQPCALPDLTEKNPEKKDKAYCLQYGRGLLSLYGQSGTDFYKKRSHYALLDDYANGDNTVPSALKKADSGPDNAVIDFRPLPLLHKPLMSVEGLLKEHSYEVSLTPVDAVSRNERAEYEGRVRAWMEHQQFLQQLGNAQPGGPGADIPVDEDDLQLHLEVSYQIREAIDLEQKIAYGMYLADFARQDQQCTRDETVKGVSVCYMQQRGPRRLPVRLDPADCFFLPTRSEDFPNLQAGAHIERLTLGQVLAEIDADPNTTLSDTERERLKEMARAQQFNTTTTTGAMHGGSYWLDSALGHEPELAGQVSVIRFAFVSTDLEVQKEYTNQFGNKQIRAMEANYQGPDPASPAKAKDLKIHRKPVQNWYEGTLILGTEIGYGCRRAYEQLREEGNEFNCLPLYIVNAPGMMGRQIKSLVDRARPIVDTASRAYVKMNHTMAKWPDLFVKFNRDALLEATVDAKGVNGTTTLTTKDILKFFIDEGITVGNDYDETGNPLGPAVKMEISPIAAAVAGHWNTIQMAKAELADLTGINGAVSGADPASRQGEGVTNLAIQGSQNALNHLFVAKHSRFERVAKAIAASVKAGENPNRTGGPAPLTGSLPVKGRNGTVRSVYVKPSPAIASRQFQLKIEQKPTEQQWQTFYAAANNALAQKEINLGDMAFLMTVDNLKQARYLLASRAKRNEQRAAQQAEANSKMQAEQAAAAAKTKGEEDRATDDYKTENKLKVIAAQSAGALAVAQVQAHQHVASTSINQEGKLQGLAMQHEHDAAKTAQAQDVQLAQHDAELTAREQESAAQRAHEQEMQPAV